MRQHADELQARRVAILAVTFEQRWIAEAYVRETDLPWPLLLDETRQTYAAYGMTEGRWRDILGASVWLAYGRLLSRGRRLCRVTGNVKQLGGDVLIDPRGIVRLHHVGRNPADRPPVATILRLATHD